MPNGMRLPTRERSMILINLLPPELRKSRRSGVNPVWLAAAAGLLICLGIAGTWLWVKYSRIPAAEAVLAGLDTDLTAATAQADKVKKVEAEITGFKQLYDRLVGLISHKVFWARTIDDFANLLDCKHDNRWTMDGYDVRCTTLTIAPAKAAAAAPARGRAAVAEAVSYSFRASLRIYGDEPDKAGDYTRSFFQSVDLSTFWRENGFVGISEAPYKGDNPQWKADIKRVIIDMPMEWRRVKVLAPPAPEPAAKPGVKR